MATIPATTNSFILSDLKNILKTVTIGDFSTLDFASFNLAEFSIELRELNNTNHLVVSDEVDSLELISVREYNESGYYWVIAMTNALTSVYDLKEGTILKIPDLSLLNIFLLDKYNQSKIKLKPVVRL